MARKLKVRRFAKRWIEGKLYLIRDRADGPRRIICEYAVANPNGSKRWLPCYEGVLYASIVPLRVRASTKNWANW